MVGLLGRAGEYSLSIPINITIKLIIIKITTQGSIIQELKCAPIVAFRTTGLWGQDEFEIISPSPKNIFESQL